MAVFTYWLQIHFHKLFPDRGGRERAEEQRKDRWRMKIRTEGRNRRMTKGCEKVDGKQKKKKPAQQTR